MRTSHSEAGQAHLDAYNRLRHWV